MIDAGDDGAFDFGDGLQGLVLDGHAADEVGNGEVEGAQGTPRGNEGAQFGAGDGRCIASSGDEQAACFGLLVRGRRGGGELVAARVVEYFDAAEPAVADDLQLVGRGMDLGGQSVALAADE